MAKITKIRQGKRYSEKELGEGFLYLSASYSTTISDETTHRDGSIMHLGCRVYEDEENLVRVIWKLDITRGEYDGIKRMAKEMGWEESK